MDEEELEEDPCYECTAYGDDYYTDENGEMQCACPECPFWGPNRED